MPNLIDTVAKLRRATPAEVDEYMANQLSGPGASPEHLHWRACLVTAVREAKLWPPSERTSIHIR